jgi:DNA-binding protein H-NS
MSIAANLNAMSLAELKELKARVERAITEFDERRRNEAMLALAETARSRGFTLAELLGETPAALKRPRAPAVAKFADPNDATRTWSGRGLKPRWFREALAAGLTPEAMLIGS